MFITIAVNNYYFTFYSSLKCGRITQIPQFIQAQQGRDRRPELNSQNMLLNKDIVSAK